MLRRLLALLPLACLLSVALSCTKPPKPTFNDATYYADAYAVETNGPKLRTALTEIISENWTYHTYSCMWTVLEYTDEDPSNSSNVLLTYSQNSFPKAQRDTGTSTIAWNREHTWPKSRGFPGETTYPYNDAHHLRACDKRVNTQRNDKDFKEGGTALCVHPYQASSSTCEVWAYQTGTTWEVPDEHKGDVARMLFYLDVRYEGQSSKEPDISLVDRASESGEPYLGFLCTLLSWHKGDVARMMFYLDVRYEGQSSKEPDISLVDRASESGEPHLGFLCTLLSWHKGDAVTTAEKNRHDKIFEWHLNRNPFIDHPEWVEVIFGDSC